MPTPTPSDRLTRLRHLEQRIGAMTERSVILAEVNRLARTHPDATARAAFAAFGLWLLGRGSEELAKMDAAAPPPHEHHWGHDSQGTRRCRVSGCGAVGWTEPPTLTERGVKP